MNWAEEISQRYLSHKKFTEEVSTTLETCLLSLEKLGVPVKCNLVSHYPLEWLVSVGLKDFVLKGNDIYKAKEVYDGNGLISNHDRDTKEVLQEILLEEYAKTF